MDFTHLNPQGRAVMVDVTEKTPSCRTALAEATLRCAPETIAAIRTGGVKKGDVLAVAQVAGIQAAKHAWELIPLCHPLPLTGVDLAFELSDSTVRITAAVRCTGPTGVEMEALTAVSVAALTVYDMCKALQKDMELTGVRLLEKTGGKSGEYRAAWPEPVGAAIGRPQTAPIDPMHTVGAAIGRPQTAAIVGMQNAGTVAAVCISEQKGVQKHPVEALELRVGVGIVGDAHAGNWHRQISLLAEESVDTMRAQGLSLAPGAFAENILTRGIELKALPVGTVLRVGTALLAVTQIGKECHNDCAIKRSAGRCVMPTDGIFAVVLQDGTVRPGDSIEIMQNLTT